MKKRNRKRKSNSRQSSKRANARLTPAAGLQSPDAGKPKKKQAGLLAVAVLVLCVAAFLNLRRFQPSYLPVAIELPTEAITSRPLASPSRGGDKRFTALSPAETGIDFTHPVLVDHPKAYLYFSSTAAGGTAVGDVNGDGRPDLFVASGPEKNRLFVQKDEAFTFADVTAKAGVDGGDAWACGATMVDINADGRLDIFVANYDSPNQLFINRGDGSFIDLAADYLLNITDASLEGTFADYDRDGFLDMYLLTYRYENPDGMPMKPPIVQRGSNRSIQKGFEKYYEITKESIGYGAVGRADGLLRNNGDGTFSDVTAAAGIHGPAHGQSATWWDFNGDGFLDLHVGNDFNDPDRLYKNNGDGTFTDVVREAVPHITWFSMGADAGDVNGDGLLDLLSSDMSSTTHFKQKTTMGAMGSNADFLSSANPRQYMRNALLLNSGVDRFKEAAYLTGLDSTDWTWAVKLADFDCDGKLDAFFTNGSVRSFTDSDRTLTLSQRKGKTEWDIYKDTSPLKERNLAFRNNGELHFTDVSQEWGLDHLGVSMSATHADFDGDGDLDLVVANLGEPLTIYRNDSQQNNRLTVRLHGAGGNRYGVGATIRVSTLQVEQIRELQPSRGFLASNEPIAHFGTGLETSVDLQVTWPTGGVQGFTNLSTGKHYEITEQSGLALWEKTSGTPAFEMDSAGGELAHRENEFDDYELQPLLPHRMSRLGPSLAAGDVDADGDMDYFIGGASGQAGRIALTTESGSLTLSSQPALDTDRLAEDMGAVWLDVDADGDIDLFVVGGGNEYELDSDVYAPRLYLNNGTGLMERVDDRLPNIRVSAGAVAASDFDRDGDVDLFVGGRQVPGKYPLPAKSYLLVNEDGRFLDSTDDIVPAARESGMVTGALWSDVDSDGDLDLLVTTEWGSIRLYRSSGGQFVDDSAQAGLTAHLGWWTGINGADLDGDGDIDYVATNMGTNTKYHATDEHPFRLYYGDFEGNGEQKLVEAEYENGTQFPIRGKSCSTHAMPSLADKFPTYKQFASASLQEIYTPQCLDAAYQCAANYLSTVVLLNDGAGIFRIEALPAEAQLSAAFGSVITEINGDGLPDIFLVQNFFSPQPETGNFDGGLGCVLAGTGDGQFTAIHTRETGLNIPEDATAAVLAEFNHDGLPDFLVATNDGDLRVVKSLGSDVSPKIIRVNFRGVLSTSQIAGTRVTFQNGASENQTIEVSAGGGYLSQQPPMLFFRNNGSPDSAIKIIWPDGHTTTKILTSEKAAINIELQKPSFGEN